MYQSIQGNLGLGKAIEYFTSHNMMVAIPLNDTQKYDLIAEIDGKLSRISVKTSRYSHTNGLSYEVRLCNTGGSSGVGKRRNFNNASCDFVFVLTGNDKIYLIPSLDISVINSITVGTKYTEYEVKTKTLSEFCKEQLEE